MNAVVGALRVTLGADTAAFEKGMTKAQRELARTGKQMSAVGASIQGVGAKMTLGLTAPILALGVAASRSATEASQAFGQVEAALKSMGAASGRTGEQLKAQAATLQHLSTFDDDDILRKVTANLLTFGNVSGKVFDDAQTAIVNISARMGTDLQGSALMVGKALNVPEKGIKSLQRVGIQFTAQQQEQIKAMSKVGDVAGAQGIMLAELNRQFGGSAEALRKATPGADTAEAWRNFQDTLGGIVNDVLPPFTRALTGVQDAFNHLSPSMQTAVVGGLALTAALGPVVTTIGGLLSMSAAARIGLAGLAGTAGGASLAMTALGRSMAFLLGPWGIVIGGTIAGAVWVLGEHTRKTRAENELLRTSMGGAKSAMDRYRDAVIAAAGASGEAAKKAREHANAMRQEAFAALQAAKALRAKQLASANEAYQRERAAFAEATRGGPQSQASLTLDTGDYFNQQARLKEAAERLTAANEGAAAAEMTYADILRMETAPALAAVTEASDKTSAAHRKGAKDADAAAAAAKKSAEDIKTALDSFKTPSQQAAEALDANMSVVRRAFFDGKVTLDQYLKSLDQYLFMTEKLSKTGAPDTSNIDTSIPDAAVRAGEMLQDIKDAKLTLVEGFDAASEAAGGLAEALESHDWMSLAKNLGTAIAGLKTAFAKGGSTEGKIGAVAGLADAAGQAIGGKAGGALSGAANAGMAAFQLTGNPYVAAAAAVVGGLKGFLDGGKAEKAAKQAAALKKAEEELARAREAAAAAAQRLKDIEAEHADLQIRLLDASGDKSGARSLSRQRELAGLLDDTSRAMQTQIYAWEDYNDQVTSAQAAVDSARSDLTAAYDREADAIETVRDGIEAVREEWQAFRDSLADFGRTLQTMAATLAGPRALTSALGARFNDVVSRIGAGDKKAFADLQGVSEEYLEAVKGSATTELEQRRELARVRAEVAKAQAYAGDQVDLASQQLAVADQQLAALNASVAGLINVNNSVMSVGQAIGNLQNALAAQGAVSASAPAPVTAVGGAAADDWSVGGANWNAWAASGQSAGMTTARGAHAISDWGRDQKLFLEQYQNAVSVGSLAAVDAYWQVPAGTMASFADKYGLPKFATGGSFTVGGAGGIDSQYFQMALSPGEMVDIHKPGSVNDNAAETRALRGEVQALTRQVQAVAVHAANLAADSRLTRKDGMPVRGVDPFNPIPVAVAA